MASPLFIQDMQRSVESPAPRHDDELFLYSFHLLELNMEGSSRHLQCEYEAEICRMMLRLICVIAFLPTMTAAAEYPSEVGQLIDLLVPGPDNPQLKRACMLQVDGNNVPCDAVWYVGFKDGAESIQFNRGSGRNPIVSFFGKHRDIDIISIDGIAMKVSQQPAQARAM
jgi:hypothetical protein